MLRVVLYLVALLVCAQGFAKAFIHPGILLDKPQLDYVKHKINANKEPWLSRYLVMKNHALAALDHQPNAKWDGLNCGGSDGAGKNDRCRHEINDARAAYTQALLWYYSEDTRYAENAIQILNAWSNDFTGQHGGYNQALQAAWALAVWTRAAEIIRYSYPWPKRQVVQFENMIRDRYLADIDEHNTDCYFGNWQAVITEAKISAAVFLEDSELFESAIIRYQTYFPLYFYLEKDGQLPFALNKCQYASKQARLKTYWNIQSKYTPLVSGHTQETCRDLEHTAYGIAGYVNTAQTAHIQQRDLFVQSQERFITALEFQASLDQPDSQLDLVCGKSVERKGGLTGTLLIAYQHYTKAHNIAMPNVKFWMDHNIELRPEGYFHYLWESLTHQR